MQNDCNTVLVSSPDTDVLIIGLGFVSDMTSPAGLGMVTSKRPAEDEPASPASKHLKTYNDFTA